MDTAEEKQRIQVFRAAGEPLGPEQMPMEGIDEAVMAGLGRVMEAGAAEGLGEQVRCLFRQPGDDGLSLCYAWFKSGYVLPRHSHNADCVYYIVGGELRLGNQVLRKGDGFFVPDGAPYSYVAGPEGVEVLEFRNATQFNFLFRNNDEAHWNRVAETYRSRGSTWATETVPPSDRHAPVADTAQ